MSITDLISRIPLFRELDESELGRVAAAATQVTYNAGHSIVEIGDPGKSLFLVLEGDVEVLYPARSSDFELARLGPGDFFGEMALLNDMPRSATVRARSDVTALKLEKEAFRRAIVETPLLGLKLLEVLSLRIRTADEQISGLSEQSQRDLLTRLLNRQAFQDRMVEEAERYRRYGSPFGLVLMDIDKFREINDTFGQDVGDATLAWLGRLITEHSRAPDVAFRTHGEEFALICPHTEGPGLTRVATRLIEIAEEATPPLDFALKLTVSAGYAACPADGRQPEEVHRVAGRALMRAKMDGRNRVRGPG